MTRDEHLTWCKQRALVSVDAGELANALASLVSDLRKHPETKNHPAIKEGGYLWFKTDKLDTPEMMRFFIESIE